MSSFFFIAWCLSGGLVAGVEFTVTKVAYGDLGDESAATLARHALGTSGVLAVTEIPGLRAARAFLDDGENLAECMRSDNAVYTELADGTIRRTVGAYSRGGAAPDSMNSDCGNVAGDLRLVVDLASRKLFKILSAKKDVVMRPNYQTFSELMHSGEHLEHLHAYEPASSSSAQEALPMHVDAGLIISMVAGKSDNARLTIELPGGDLAEAVYEEDSVLFLVGEGCSKWLAADDFLRPTPHALTMTEGPARAWYGKMWLPPADAVVESSQLPFVEHRERMRDHIYSASDNSVGCSMEEDEDHQRKLSSATVELCTTQSGDEGILCWAQCVSVESLDCAQEQSACVEFSTQTILDGSSHCPTHSFDDCGPLCVSDLDHDDPNATVVKVSSDDGFCVGEGVTMYMDGFRSIFENSSPLCVNFWLIDWTLDTRFRFAWGVVAAFLVGLSVEGLVRIRRTVHDTRYCAFGKLFLHFCQSVLGYLAMFIAMTYNVELFFSVCLGATSGHFLFNFKNKPQTNDPCCVAAQQSETLLVENDQPPPASNSAACCSTTTKGSSCCSSMKQPNDTDAEDYDESKYERVGDV